MSITRTTRTTSDPLADIAALAVHELRWACGCIRYTNDRGHTSTAIHDGAPAGHTPTGASTDVTRSAHSQRKAAAKVEPRPKTVTRGKSVPMTPAQVMRAAQQHIKLIDAKGGSKTLDDVKFRKVLARRIAELNAEERVRGDADVARAKEKMRVRRAQHVDTIDVTQNNTAAELRNAALAGLDRESYRLPPSVADQCERLLHSSDDDRNSTKMAKMFLATESAAYHSLFQKSMSPNPVFTPAEGEAMRRYQEVYHDEIRAAAESGSFGLAIPFTLSPAIQAAGQELAPIVAAASNRVVTTNAWHGVASVGSSFAIAAEGAVIADNAAVLTGPSIPLYAGKAFIPYSTEVSQDWPSFSEEMANLLNRGWLDLLSNLSAVGAGGTSAPTGVFTAMQNSTASPNAHVTVSTVGSVGSLDLRKAWSSLGERYKPVASWVMHEDVLAKIRNEAGSASQLDVTVDRQGTCIMGRPVITSAWCPDWTGTTGSENFCVVGDLSSFTVVQHQSMMVEVIPQMRATATGYPLGQSGLLAMGRVGMDVSVLPGLKLLSNS